MMSRILSVAALVAMLQAGTSAFAGQRTVTLGLVRNLSLRNW